MQAYVSLEIKKNIAEITFGTPKSNSLPSEILEKLAQTILNEGSKPEVKAILLKSEGEKAFCAGASGWCTVAPNLLGNLPNQLYQAIKNGDLAQAQILFYKQLPLLRFIVQGGLPKTVKAGLNELGFNVGDPRKPLQKASPDEVNQLKSLIKLANTL